MKIGKRDSKRIQKVLKLLKRYQVSDKYRYESTQLLEESIKTLEKINLKS